MDPWENNYLLSIHVSPEVITQEEVVNQSPGSSSVPSVLNLPRTEVGLAWIDLSSGDYKPMGAPWEMMGGHHTIPFCIDGKDLIRGH